MTYRDPIVKQWYALFMAVIYQRPAADFYIDPASKRLMVRLPAEFAKKPRRSPPNPSIFVGRFSRPYRPEQFIEDVQLALDAG